MSFAMLLLSGVAWFLLVAGAMTDWPLKQANVSLVWKSTHFGRLWQLRAVLAFATAAGKAIPYRKIGRITSCAGGAALLISLAWAGHGQLGEHVKVHLIIDALHLLVAGFWPTMLLPLAIILSERSIERGTAIAVLTRFSTMSVVAVIAIASSGIINAGFTLDRWSDLTETRYGSVLIAKVAVVAVMIGIGGINRRSIRQSKLLPIRRRLGAEIVLAVVLIAATGWLGTLEP